MAGPATSPWDRCAACSRPGSPLDGDATLFNGQMHINYLDAEGDAHELVYKEPSWQACDLTAGAGAPPACARQCAGGL